MPENTYKNSPIGIFDSGVGGLTVAREVYRLLPNENVVYFGDVGRTPYGGRSKEIIQKFTEQDISFLIEHKVKFIICACNSASSVGLDVAKKRFDLPIIGVIEPGASAAVRRTKSGRIGVIGTTATITSNAYAHTIHQIDPDIKVFSLACPLFVPLADEGYTDKKATYLIAKDYLQTMTELEIDTLVMGCTHYPLLREVIGDTMGDGVILIDSGIETARVAERMLKENDLLTESKKPGEHKYFVSDVPDKFSQVATRFLGREISNITRVNVSGY